MHARGGAILYAQAAIHGCCSHITPPVFTPNRGGETRGLLREAVTTNDSSRLVTDAKVRVVRVVSVANVNQVQQEYRYQRQNR